MKRLLIVLAVIAAPVRAFDWPWEHSQTIDYAYCKGFVSAGLGEFPVQNLSRIQLWLAWNDINRATSSLGEISAADLQSGHDRFANLLASNDIDSLLQIASEDCGMAHN